MAISNPPEAQPDYMSLRKTPGEGYRRGPTIKLRPNPIRTKIQTVVEKATDPVIAPVEVVQESPIPDPQIQTEIHRESEALITRILENQEPGKPMLLEYRNQDNILNTGRLAWMKGRGPELHSLTSAEMKKPAIKHRTSPFDIWNIKALASGLDGESGLILERLNDYRNTSMHTLRKIFDIPKDVLPNGLFDSVFAKRTIVTDQEGEKISRLHICRPYKPNDNIDLATLLTLSMDIKDEDWMRLKAQWDKDPYVIGNLLQQATQPPPDSRKPIQESFTDIPAPTKVYIDLDEQYLPGPNLVWNPSAGKYDIRPIKEGKMLVFDTPPKV